MISRDLGYPLQEAEPLPSAIFLAARLTWLWIDACYSALIFSELLFVWRWKDSIMASYATGIGEMQLSLSKCSSFSVSSVNSFGRPGHSCYLVPFELRNLCKEAL